MWGGGGVSWSKLTEVCAQQVENVFGELEGSAIHFMYEPRNFRISFQRVDITAREFVTRGVRKQQKDTKANNPEAQVCIPFMVLLIWTNTVLCVWIEMYCFGLCVRSLWSPDAPPLWCHGSAAGDRQNALQPTKGRGLVSRGRTGADTRPWLFHNSSDLKKRNETAAPVRSV